MGLNFRSCHSSYPFFCSASPLPPDNIFTNFEILPPQLLRPGYYGPVLNQRKNYKFGVKNKWAVGCKLLISINLRPLLVLGSHLGLVVASIVGDLKLGRWIGSCWSITLPVELNSEVYTHQLNWILRYTFNHSAVHCSIACFLENKFVFIIQSVVFLDDNYTLQSFQLSCLPA